MKGPKGTLDSKIHPMMTAKVENGEVLVTRPNDEKEARSLHGLTRTLISNMVEGVTNGYKKSWRSRAWATALRSRARTL